MRHLRKCQKELTEAQPQCDDGPQIVAELHLTIDLMMSACKSVSLSSILTFKANLSSAIMCL